MHYPLHVLAGECTSLEQKLQHVEASEALLQTSSAKLAEQLTDTQERLADVTAARDKLQGEQGMSSI